MVRSNDDTRRHVQVLEERIGAVRTGRGRRAIAVKRANGRPRTQHRSPAPSFPDTTSARTTRGTWQNSMRCVADFSQIPSFAPLTSKRLGHVQDMRVEIQRLTPSEVEFDLVGVDASIANAIRRVLIAEVGGFLFLYPLKPC